MSLYCHLSLAWSKVVCIASVSIFGVWRRRTLYRLVLYVTNLVAAFFLSFACANFFPSRMSERCESERQYLLLFAVARAPLRVCLIEQTRTSKSKGGAGGGGIHIIERRWVSWGAGSKPPAVNKRAGRGAQLKGCVLLRPATSNTGAHCCRSRRPFRGKGKKQVS